jgi:hypothetical protein
VEGESEMIEEISNDNAERSGGLIISRNQYFNSGVLVGWPLYLS